MRRGNSIEPSQLTLCGLISGAQPAGGISTNTDVTRMTTLGDKGKARLDLGLGAILAQLGEEPTTEVSIELSGDGKQFVLRLYSRYFTL